MSASRTPRPPLPGPPSAHHERPRRAPRRAPGPLAAVLAALLAVLAPAGIWSQTSQSTISIEAVHASRFEGQEAEFRVISRADFIPSRGVRNDDVTVTVAVTETGGFLSGTPPTSVAVAPNGSAVLRVPTDNDDRTEDDGSVTVQIVARDAYSVHSTKGQATVAVKDNDRRVWLLGQHEIGTPATVTTIVTDNDLSAVPLVHRDIPRVTDNDPTLHVVASHASKVEGETVTFVVFATSIRTERLTIDVEVTEEGDFLLRRPPLTSVTMSAGSNQVQISLGTYNDDEAELDGALTVRLVARAGYTIDPDRAEATTIVTDNEPRDLPVVGIKVAPDSADEGTAFLITAIRDGNTAESLTVRLSVADSGDFTELASSSLTFAEGEAETTLTLPTDDDDADEADGTLTVTLDADDAYRIDASAGTRSVTVRDNDLPVLTMVAQDYEIDEGEAAVFVLTRTGDRSVPLTVSVGFAGRPEFDFGLTPDTERDVTFAAGNATATLSVATVDDDRYFLRRDFLGTLRLVPSEFRIALPGPASEHGYIDSGNLIVNKVIVTDNDVGKVWVAASADSVPESGRACFTISTDALVRGTGTSVDMDVTVAVTQEGDYLAAGADGQRTVTMDAGDNGDAELCVDLDDDEVSEVHGSVQVEVLSTSEGDGVVPDPDRNKARVTVRDDELPVLTMAPAANVIDEGETAEFVLTRTGELSEPLTVSVGFVGRPEPSAFGLEPYSSPDVTFTAGSATATLSVATVDDDRYFAYREILAGITPVRSEFRIELPQQNTPHVFASETAIANIVIVTDNDEGKVWVTAAADSVPESGRACFTLHTDAIVRDVGFRENDMDITVAVTQEGDYMAAGADGQRTVTLDGNDTLEQGLEDGEVPLCLDLDDDEVSEVHGAVAVEVLSTSEGDGVVPDPDRNKARVTVRDDELPVLNMAPAANVIDEGDTAEFVLTRSGDLSEPLTVTTGFVGRPPVTFGLTPDQDRDVTFTAGSATATLSVATVDDERHFLRRDLLGFLALVPSRFRIALSEPASEHAHIYGDSIVNKVIVTDNDVGKVWVAASADSVPESGRACFTISTDALVRDTDASVDMDVTVAVTQEGDYLAGAAGQRTVTLDDGDSDAGLCLDLDDDDVSEVYGSVQVEVLSTSEGDGVVPDTARNKATVTVRDDELPVVTMAPEANVINEGETAEFVLTRSGDLSEPLTVNVSVEGRPHGHGLTLDYIVRRDVTFAAGSATATRSVATIDDDRYFLASDVLAVVTAEPSRFQIALAGPATPHVSIEGGSLLINVVFVTDDDVGQVWVSASADSVPESRRACFTLRTDAIVRDVGSRENDMDITVAVTQEGDYLAAGADGQRTVTLDHGDSEVELCLDLVDDQVDEHDGAVIVEVRSTSEGDGVVPDPARSTARVTVRDDEPTYLTLATAATTVDEGGSVTFTLTREGPLDEPLAVPGPLLRSYDSDQSFLAPHREHPVTFAPGTATATFTVTPQDDELFSVQRDLYVQLVTELQGVRGGFSLRVLESSVLVVQSSSIITRYRLPVSDNDLVRVSITPRTAEVDEGEPACVTVASDAVFPAYRQSEIAVTVAVSQQGDYLAAPPGNHTVTLSTRSPAPALCLELDDDDQDEPSGAVTVTLVTEDGSRVVAGEPASATVTVHDNDPPFVTLMTTATQVAEAGSVTFTLTREGSLTAPLTIPATLLQSNVHPVTPGHDLVSRGHEVTFDAGSDTVTVTIAPGADDLHFEFRQLNVHLRTSNVGLFRLRVPDAPAAGSYNDATRTAYHLPVVEDDPIRIAVEPRHPYVYEQEQACFTFGNNVVAHDFKNLLDPIAFTVTVSAQGDFLASPPADRTVTMDEEEPTHTLCLELADDTVLEAEGSVTVAIVADADANIVVAADRATATVRLLDNELPELTLSAVADSVTEGEHARFKLALDAPVVLPFSVLYRIETTGDYGFEVSAADSVWLSIVSAGVEESVLQVITRDDGVDEPDGSVTFTLLEGMEYTGEYTIAPDSPRSVTVTVADDDLPIISMPPKTDEESLKRYGEGEEVSFTFIRDGDLSEPLTIPAVHLKSRYPSDLTPGWTDVGPLVFEAGSTTTTVTITTEDDDFYYGTRTLLLRLGFGGSDLFRTVDDWLQRSVTVRDDDLSKVTLSVEAVEASVSEADQACFLLKAENLWFDAQWRLAGIGYNVKAYVEQEGTFLAETNASGRGRVLSDRSMHVASERRCVDLDDDDRFEPDGSVTLSVLEFLGSAIPEAQRPRATVTVTDDDFVPTLVSVVAESSSIAEGDWARFSLTRTFGSHEGGLSVEVMVREEGGPYLDRSATLLLSQDYGDWWGAPMEDLDADGRGVVYLRATSGERVDVRVATADDLVAEAPGFITVELSTPDADAPYALGGSASATIEVRSDDGGEVSVEAVTPEVTEGEDAVFRFTRTGSEGRLQVNVAIRGHKKVMSDATRTLAENTGPAPDLTIVFEDGVTEVTQTLTTEADRYNEGDGEVVLLIERLRPGTGALPYRVAGAASAAVLVRDDDIPEVELRWISPAVALVDNVWVGRIVEGSTIEFEATCTGGTLAPLGDPFNRLRIIREKEELMNHPLNTSGSYERPRRALRMPCADQPMGTLHNVIDGRQRYTGPANGTISIDLLPQRHFIATETIVPTCYEDMTRHAWKRGNVEFCPKYTLGAVTSARVTVLNRNPTITVAAVADAVTEGEPARFRLTRIWAADLLHPSDGYTTTVELTAAAKGGYVAGNLPTGSHTFGLGVTEMIIEVPTVADVRIAPEGEITLELVPEGTESSRVNIGGSYEIYDQLEGITPPGKSSLRATVRIVNDDTEAGLVVGADGVFVEGDGTSVFSVTLTRPSTKEVTVNWLTEDGNAVAGQDYVDGRGTLTFAVGEVAKTIAVELIDDEVAEPIEYFGVSLREPQNAEIHVFLSFGRITDDDVPPVTIAARAASVVEGDDAVFVLTRGGDVGAALDATVQIRRYEPGAPELAGTARFPAGSRTAEVTVPTADDGVVDTRERVIRATVAAGDGYAVGDPASASVAVTDNDAVRELRLDRSISPTFVAAGNEVYFGYTVTNLGNVATGAPLTIVDDVAGELTCGTEPLDPRAGDQVDQALCATDYVATAADVAAGRIVSTAYATDGVTRSPAARVVVVRQDQAVLSICNGAQQEGAFCDPTWEVAEDVGSVTLTVYLSHALESAVSVPWTTAAATATAGADFAAGEGTLTFDAGDRTRDVVVTITDDTLDESRETFHVDLGTPHNAVLGVERATVAIRDDDERPAIAVEGPVPAQPNEGDGYVEYYLTLDAASGRRVEVSYATADGAAPEAADPWPPALAGEDYERTAGRLTFAPGESRKTVRIPILSDAVHESREEFRFTVSDPHAADLNVEPASPRVVIRDDDAASSRIILTVSPNPLPEAGGDIPFTVTGTFNKGAQQDPVTVDLAIAGGTATAGSDFTAPAPFQLTIPGAATSGTATVTLSVTGDDLDEEDETLLLTGAAEGFTMGPEGGRQITIADDDTRGLTVSATALAIDEGADASYTVALASQPTEEVTVAVSAGEDAGVTVTPASLTFTTADWSDAQTVTVTAPQDADGADEAAVVAHDATGGDYEDESAQVTVRVADDETPSTAVALTAQPPAVAEGGGSHDVTVTATLNAAPRKTATAVAVTVQPEAAAPGAAADWAPVDGFTITIAAGQTSAAATFTLAPVADDVDEADERVALRGATGVEALPAADAFVTVTDDDTRGVTVSPTALAIDEGEDAGYAVALTSAPTGPVLVTVTAPADADLRADPRLLEFTAADWSTAQTVTVHALADADAAADAPATLTHAVSGGDYDGQSAAGVTVTIGETDTLAITLAAASAAEAAGAVTFAVTLTALAPAEVRVAYATADGSARADTDYAQTGGTLTFAAGDKSRLIRVPVTDDALDEGDAETFTLTLSGAAGAPLPDGAATLTVTGTIEDDDARGITVAPTALALAEDAAGAYAVALTSQPSADVTVALTVTGDRDLTAAPAALTFTAADWRQPRRVTVTAADDADAADDAATVTHAVRGGDYEAHAVAPVTVTVADDDSASTAVTLSVEPAALAEAAARTAVTVTAVLDAAARTTATAVTVTVGSGTATAGADFAAVSAFTVTIPAGAYRATGTFRLAPVDDAVDEGDETVAVSGSTGAAGLDVSGAAVTIADDDARGMTVSAHALDLDEGGERTYTVVLTSQPTVDVTVDLTVAADRPQVGDAADRSAPVRDGAAVTVQPLALSFTAADWQTPKTVTVRGAADPDAVDDRARILNHARGGDYDRVPADVVTVTVRDDDTAALIVPAALTVAEGRTATYRVALATRPSGPVTVTIDGAAGTDLTVSSARLTFAVATWDRAQEVRVSAAADADAADDTATLGHTAAGGGYGGLTAQVAVTVTDATPTLRIAGAAAAESAAALLFEVLLSAPASGAVTVGYATADGSAQAGADYTAAAADATLTIEAGARSAVIAVPVVDDALDEADAETFTVTLRDPVQAALADGAQAATGTILDDDARGVTVAPTVLELDEGGSGSYTVALRSRPTDAVTVTVAGAAGDVSVVEASRTLIFAAGAWDTAQTVTVNAAADADALADALVTLTHTVRGGDYDGVAADPVTVRVFENDLPVLALADVRADEDAGALVLAVTLSTPSSRDVTVRYRTADGSGAAGAVAGQDYRQRTGTLAFPAGSSAAQEIRVPLVDDAVAEGDETFTVTLHDAAHATLAGGGDTRAATATIADDDGRGVTVAPTALEVPEGRSATYTVALRSQPTDPVTVTVAGWTGDVSVPASSRTLTFATGAWDTAQTVTVEAAADDDALADALVTLTHAVSGGDYAGVAAEPVTVRIIEADAPVLAIAGARAAEDAGALVFAVTLSLAGSDEVTVDYATADGSGDAGAKAGHDYQRMSGTLTFAAGTAAAQEIRVPITDDAVDEAAEETFTVTLSDAKEADLAGGGSTLAATGTIVDDDARGVTVSPTALVIDEGASGSYTVVLTSQPTGAVTVRAAIPGDTDDSLSPEALTFGAGDWSTARTVTVRAAEDDDALADELRVRHAVTGADYDALPAAEVAVRIRENDRPELALTAARAAEDAGVLVFTVTPSLASSERVTVDYATADGSGAAGAQAGQDYEAVSGTLIFPAGAAAAQEIRVPITDDAADEEEEETFTLTLRGALRATLAGGGDTLAATGTIVDDDDPAVTVAFASERVTAHEGGAAAIVRVELGADPERTVSVPLTRAPGAGVADGDYAGVPASVTFGAGQTAATFTVSATDDAVDEDDERVALGFGTPLPAGVTAGSPDGVTVTLADDDARGVTVSETALEIDEGAGGSYTVALTSQPTEAVKVTAALPPAAAVSLDRTTLTFTAADWRTAQTVTVTADARRRRGGARRGHHCPHRRRRRLRRRARRRRDGAHRRDRHPGARRGGRARRRGRRQPDLHHPHERGQQPHRDGGVVDRRRHGAGRQRLRLHRAGRQRDVPARRAAQPHRQRADRRRPDRRAGRDLHGDAARPRARGAGGRRCDRHHRRRRHARGGAVGRRAGVPRRRRRRQLHGGADLAADRGGDGGAGGGSRFRRGRDLRARQPALHRRHLGHREDRDGGRAPGPGRGERRGHHHPSPHRRRLRGPGGGAGGGDGARRRDRLHRGGAGGGAGERGRGRGHGGAGR